MNYSELLCRPVSLIATVEPPAILSARHAALCPVSKRTSHAASAGEHCHTVDPAGPCADPAGPCANMGRLIYRHHLYVRDVPPYLISLLTTFMCIFAAMTRTPPPPYAPTGTYYYYYYCYNTITSVPTLTLALKTMTERLEMI